jgi:peptide-methionine (S)-S-oxide reductase
MKRALQYLLCLGALAGGLATGLSQKMNATSSDGKTTNGTELATLGGGCFWCVEAVYEQLDGVKSVTSGYAGGKRENPTYEEVCSGTSGHAEVTQIEFDPKKISFEQLLEVFWAAHDPTTLNRQGADVGTQYRSIVLYHNEAQKLAAEKARKLAQSEFSSPIVTEISPMTRFYKAEGYHQDYYRNNPRASYCAFVIRPKLEKLQKKLGKLSKPSPAKE